MTTQNRNKVNKLNRENFVQTATTFTDMSDDESVDEPEEVKRAWEELMIIQREQQR